VVAEGRRVKSGDGIKKVRGLSMGDVKQRQRAEARAYFEQQRGITRCALCQWKHRGEMGTGQMLFRQHVEHKHAVAA
jgi:hypothetical protein